MTNVGGDGIRALWDVDLPKGLIIEREWDKLEVALLTPAPPTLCDKRTSGHVLERNAVDDFINELLGERIHSTMSRGDLRTEVGAVPSGQVSIFMSLTTNDECDYPRFSRRRA